MPRPRFRPRYGDLPANRREHIARHFDAAMSELQRAGREFNIPEGRVRAMWGDVLRLPDNRISPGVLKGIFLKHAERPATEKGKL
jgi:hypothetical protein